MLQKKPDFRFNRMRKSGKTEFIEVHIERSVITQLENSVVRDIPHFLATCAHAHCLHTSKLNFLLALSVDDKDLKSHKRV